MLPQQYCLRWRYHHSNLQTMFSALLEREAFCDVTLACENRTIKAHKIVLSACSTYFETILSQYEEKDPILIMKDVKYVDIRCLVEFMYKGEINVDHCHLATLLKTAEELKIKGLAEVSWRDEDQQQSHNNSDQGGGAAAAGGGGSSNGYQSTALPHVSTVMNDPKTSDSSGLPSAKRKRGRPPIDDYEQAFPTPRIMNVQGNAHHHEENYSNDAMSTSDHDLSIWEEEPSANEAGDTTEPDEPTIRVKTELSMMDDDCMIDDQYSRQHDNSMKGSKSSSSNTNTPASGSQSFLTPALEREWQDVVKMNDYLNTGRRQQFWEEPFTKRVMEGIQKKSLEMKVAAELLGVSYGTLYGRYRDTYGCLKHPYRARDFWTEQIPTDIVSKLRRKEITLGRAAEQLNVTPQTLSSYLTTAAELNTMSNHQLNNSNQSNASINVMACYDEGDSEEDALGGGGDTVLPDNPSSNNTSLFKKILSATAAAAAANGNTANHHITTTAKTTSASSSSSSNSVLANCPDITIIKKEKYDGGSSKFNNNSDHSDSTNNSDQANNQ